MYDGSVGICLVHLEIRESDMCKFENNGIWQRNFQQRKAQKWYKNAGAGCSKAD
jgi:hypothetical protein